MKTSDIKLTEVQPETFSTIEGLDRYNESLGDDQPWCNITEIVVPSERDKSQLLKAFEYIHNLREIDSGYLAVNTIMHMYHCPDRITVKS